MAALALMSATAIAHPAQADVQYVYDSAGRLVRAIYSNGVTIEYKYDAAGNRREILTSQIPNRSPSAGADTVSVGGGTSVDIAVLANDSDPDGDALSISAVGTPSGGGSVVAINGNTVVRYTSPETSGARTFTYTVSDGRGATASATVTVTVVAVNRAPTANDDSADSSASSSTVIQALSNDSDPDGNTLVVTSAGSATGGSVSVGSGGSYIIYTAPDQDGQYSFVYTISDGAGGTASATVYVAVSTLEEPCDFNSGVFCEAPP